MLNKPWKFWIGCLMVTLLIMFCSPVLIFLAIPVIIVVAFVLIGVTINWCFDDSGKSWLEFLRDQ